MKDLAYAQRLAAVLVRQTHQIEKMVSPKSILAAGERPSTDRMLMVALDTIGVLSMAMTVILQELIVLTEPTLVEDEPKGQQDQ
jgi:hypothetical protein